MNANIATSKDAERLAVLPGLMCDSRMFSAQIGAFDAVVIDAFYGGATSLEAMARYALARLPARFALLGHSMGARVALEIWRAAPERVARLALADSGSHLPRAGEADARYRLRDIGRTAGAAALVDAWLPPMVAAHHRDDRALMDRLHAMAVAAGTATYEAQIAALLQRPNFKAVLATVTCPTVAIVGRHDSWAPIAQHEHIVARIPGAWLAIVEGAGHMAPAEEPDRFNAALREWLATPATPANPNSQRKAS